MADGRAQLTIYATKTSELLRTIGQTENAGPSIAEQQRYIASLQQDIETTTAQIPDAERKVHWVQMTINANVYESYGLSGILASGKRKEKRRNLRAQQDEKMRSAKEAVASLHERIASLNAAVTSTRATLAKHQHDHFTHIAATTELQRIYATVFEASPSLLPAVPEETHARWRLGEAEARLAVADELYTSIGQARLALTQAAELAVRAKAAIVSIRCGLPDTKSGIADKEASRRANTDYAAARAAWAMAQTAYPVGVGEISEAGPSMGAGGAQLDLKAALPVLRNLVAKKNRELTQFVTEVERQLGELAIHEERQRAAVQADREEVELAKKDLQVVRTRIFDQYTKVTPPTAVPSSPPAYTEEA